MQNYVFDLYGTLVDIRTEEEDPVVWEKLALFYGYYDALYTPEALQRRYGQLVSSREASMADSHEAHPEIRIEEVFSALFAEKGVMADAALAIHAGQFFRVLSTRYVRLYEGAAATLKALKERGKSLYLLSNAQRIFTEFELHTLNIAQYFDDILISSDYGVKKPDRRFFDILLRRHRLDPAQTVMIGNDGTSDIAGAKAVGLSTVYIRSNISPKEALPDADYALTDMDSLWTLLTGDAL